MGLELEEAVERQIVQRTWGRIHQLHVERREGRLQVHGCTPSYYFKQLALLAIQEVCDAVPVDLDIQVGDSELRATEGHNRNRRILSRGQHF